MGLSFHGEGHEETIVEFSSPGDANSTQPKIECDTINFKGNYIKETERDDCIFSLILGQRNSSW